MKFQDLTVIQQYKFFVNFLNKANLSSIKPSYYEAVGLNGYTKAIDGLTFDTPFGPVFMDFNDNTLGFIDGHEHVLNEKTIESFSDFEHDMQLLYKLLDELKNDTFDFDNIKIYAVNRTIHRNALPDLINFKNGFVDFGVNKSDAHINLTNDVHYLMKIIRSKTYGELQNEINEEKAIIKIDNEIVVEYDIKEI